MQFVFHKRDDEIFGGRGAHQREFCWAVGYKTSTIAPLADCIPVLWVFYKISGFL
jgi:hypothetical protein